MIDDRIFLSLYVLLFPSLLAICVFGMTTVGDKAKQALAERAAAVLGTALIITMAVHALGEIWS